MGKSGETVSCLSSHLAGGESGLCNVLHVRNSLACFNIQGTEYNIQTLCVFSFSIKL